MKEQRLYRLITHDSDNNQFEVDMVSNDYEKLRNRANAIVAYSSINRHNKSCEILEVMETFG